jgi:hypothetical protein
MAFDYWSGVSIGRVIVRGLPASRRCRNTWLSTCAIGFVGWTWLGARGRKANENCMGKLTKWCTSVRGVYVLVPFSASAAPHEGASFVAYGNRAAPFLFSASSKNKLSRP